MQQGILDKEPPTGDGQIPDSATHKPHEARGLPKPFFPSSPQHNRESVNHALESTLEFQLGEDQSNWAALSKSDLRWSKWLLKSLDL